MGAARRPVAPVRTVVVAIVDTETTGLGRFDEPIAIGVVLCEVSLPKGNLIREIGVYHGLREPNVPIRPEAFRVHGIALERLRGKTFDTPRLQWLFGQAACVIAHYCSFDSRMLIPLLPELASKAWLCSVQQIPWQRLIGVQNRKLDTICDHFGIGRPSPHNALDDCYALLSALMQPTGKTARSRTFLGLLIAEDRFIIGAQAAPVARTYEQQIEARFAPRLTSTPRRLEPHPFEAMRAAEEAQDRLRSEPEPRTRNPFKWVLVIFALAIFAYVIAGILR